jgi:hypothetical protein
MRCKPIVARNITGDEIILTISERCGLVCITGGDDNDLTLVLTHGNAVELCLQMIEALFRQHRRGEVGPISASF